MLFLPSLLDRNDKMTMFASIECRVPFLDYRLVELANRLPDRWRRRYGVGKRVLRTQFKNLLPRAVQKRGKLGFGVPMDAWLRSSTSLREALRTGGVHVPVPRPASPAARASRMAMWSLLTPVLAAADAVGLTDASPQVLGRVADRLDEHAATYRPAS